MFALKSWQKANKIAEGKCVPCLTRIYELQMETGDPKQAAVTAALMEGLVTGAQDRGAAAYFHGRALLQQAGDDKPKKELLEQAVASFQRSTEAVSSRKASYFLAGRSLAYLGRDAEASAKFQAYVAHAREGDAMLLRARHFAENPELARHRQAPPIAVTTLTGKRFNLDEMSGRVVLIDFWATWCGPCNQELPHMKKLAQKYANEPFEIVSISWDDSEERWKQFVQAHEMTWSQYRDTDHALSDAFGVNSIPHYFTIDSDGVLTAENVGSGSMADGRIDKLIKRARESAHPDGSGMKMAAAGAE